MPFNAQLTQGYRWIWVVGSIRANSRVGYNLGPRIPRSKNNSTFLQKHGTLCSEARALLNQEYAWIRKCCLMLAYKFSVDPSEALSCGHEEACQAAHLFVKRGKPTTFRQFVKYRLWRGVSRLCAKRRTGVCRGLIEKRQTFTFAPITNNGLLEGWFAPENLCSYASISQIDEVCEVLESLDYRLCLILLLYYGYEWTEKEVAEALGVTKQRVSQLRLRTIKKVQAAYGVET